MTKARVLFVGGAGRSGSTVLEHTLANSPSVICVGELNMIWEAGLEKNTLMPNGIRFRDHEFWRAVISDLTTETDLDLARIYFLQRNIVRSAVFLLNETDAFRSKQRAAWISEYVDLLDRLFTAIDRVSGGKVILDSSKNPVCAGLVNRCPGIITFNLHLVRDPRAVVYSWRTPKVLPESGGTQLMDRRSVAFAIMKWIYANVSMERIGKRYGRYALIRYEEFTQSPARVLGRALSEMTLSADIVAGIDFDRLVWPETFSVHGNPVRFNKGALSLRADNRWRTSIRSFDRRATEVWTSPLMKRYGYA